MNQLVTVAQYEVADIEKMARAIAGSKLFGINTPEQALALCLIAAAEGRHPASAAQDYHIISNRPSKKSDAMLRDFLANGGKVADWVLTDTKVSATFSHPSGGTVTIDWDMARAKKAGIANPMWNKYPRQMLRARVVSEGVRTVFPMATSGMYVPEEVQEFDAPKTTQTVIVDASSGEIIEADVVPPAEPKKQLVKVSREAEKQMREEVDACGTTDELKALWDSSLFQEEFDKLGQSYKDGLIETFNERLQMLKAHPAPMPSLSDQFDRMERIE